MRRQRPNRGQQSTRRHLVALGVAALLPTAGCLDANENEEALATPKADHPIRLSNDREESVEVTVTVIRESTGETVYTETHRLAAGEQDKTVYNTERANPSGIESFRVELRSGGDTVTETVETSACYGSVIGTVSDAGLRSTYSIC